MKRRGIKILLALVLSSALLFGTFGIVNAGNPHTFYANADQLTAATITYVRADIGWTGYRAYGYYYEWWLWDSGQQEFVKVDDGGEFYGTLNKVPPSPIIELYGPTTVGQWYQIRVWLYKKNGSVGKKPYTWANHTIVTPGGG